MGVGDWELGTGAPSEYPIPNTQNPVPSTQYPVGGGRLISSRDIDKTVTGPDLK